MRRGKRAGSETSSAASLSVSLLQTCAVSARVTQRLGEVQEDVHWAPMPAAKDVFPRKEKSKKRSTHKHVFVMGVEARAGRTCQCVAERWRLVWQSTQDARQRSAVCMSDDVCRDATKADGGRASKWESRDG